MKTKTQEKDSQREMLKVTEIVKRQTRERETSKTQQQRDIVKK